VTDGASQQIDLVRTTVQKFVRERPIPLEEDVERNDDIDPEVLTRLRSEAVELGLYGFNMPASIGGPGLSASMQLAILQEMTFSSGRFQQRSLFKTRAGVFRRLSH
jgi:alkylation response protein AidB-like acyl-CoA dehydrogenase